MTRTAKILVLDLIWSNGRVIGVTYKIEGRGKCATFLPGHLRSTGKRSLIKAWLESVIETPEVEDDNVERTYRLGGNSNAFRRQRQLVKQLGGKYDAELKAWTVRADANNHRALEQRGARVVA
jgi:hypothetical protein